MKNSAPVDRISSLPDELLCHILSFLPTKLAFSTAVLSRRWTPLFKLIATLHFVDESFSNKSAFSRVVETIMHSIELIKTFHLNCHSKHCRFSCWIKTAKQHPLENLQLLSTFHYNGISLCPSIFLFPTLVVLKLTRLHVVDNISVDLPSLKVLHLIHVYFKNKDNFNKLLNGCPILEDLQTRIYYTEEQGEGVRLNTLSKLMRANISTIDVPIKAIHNVHFLQLKMLGMPLEPKINSYYSDFLLLESLVQLELRFYNMQYHWDDVVNVLLNCTKLQILSITQWSDLNNQDLYRNWRNRNIVPKCISSQLRSCTLNFEGLTDEIQFATYILMNAPLLRVMKITIAESSCPCWNALKELKSSCPTISPKCQLSINFT